MADDELQREVDALGDPPPDRPAPQAEAAPDSDHFPVPRRPPRSHFWPRTRQMERQSALAIRRVGRQLLRVAPQLDEPRFRPLLALFATRFERWQRMTAQLSDQPLLNRESNEFRRSVDTINRVEDGILRMLAEIRLTPKAEAEAKPDIMAAFRRIDVDRVNTILRARQKPEIEDVTSDDSRSDRSGEN